MQLIDSVLVLNLLKSFNATELYCVWVEPVHSLLALPVALAIGIAASIVPAVPLEGAAGQSEQAKQKTLLGVKLTIVFALPAAVGFGLLAEPIVKLLYSGLTTPADLELAAQLVRISTVTVPFVALIQTFTAAHFRQAGSFTLP